MLCCVFAKKVSDNIIRSLSGDTYHILNLSSYNIPEYAYLQLRRDKDGYRIIRCFIVRLLLYIDYDSYLLRVFLPFY